MKRLDRAPERFDVLDLFARMARDGNLPFDEDSSQDEFARRVAASIGQARRSPTLLHGRRTQELFGYVAASLGSAKLIKSEDGGDIISDESELRVPDFRLVLRDGKQLLVEVKNCHSRSPRTAVRLDQPYLSSLRSYGDLTGSPVFIAVYWSGWNLWTLTPLDEFPPGGLTLLSASLRNHMVTLGDEAIATTPPLTLRIVADPASPRTRRPSGEVELTIGNVEFFCGGRPITDKTERRLAFLLMILGTWPEADTDVAMDGESLVHIDFVYAPEEVTSGQPFEIIGHQSGFVSRRFDFLTTREKSITSLSPADAPGSLGLGIPENYVSDALPLWRFRMKPSPIGAS